jgi:hypothetical protein
MRMKCEWNANGMRKEWERNGKGMRMERNGEKQVTHPPPPRCRRRPPQNTRLLERLKRGYPALAEQHIRPQTLRVPLLGQDIRHRFSYDSRLRAPLLGAITTIITIVIAIAVNTRRRLFGRNRSSCKKQRTDRARTVAKYRACPLDCYSISHLMRASWGKKKKGGASACACECAYWRTRTRWAVGR